MDVGAGMLYSPGRWFSACALSELSRSDALRTVPVLHRNLPTTVLALASAVLAQTRGVLLHAHLVGALGTGIGMLAIDALPDQLDLARGLADDRPALVAELVPARVARIALRARRHALVTDTERGVGHQVGAPDHRLRVMVVPARPLGRHQPELVRLTHRDLVHGGSRDVSGRGNRGERLHLVDGRHDRTSDGLRVVRLLGVGRGAGEQRARVAGQVVDLVDESTGSAGDAGGGVAECGLDDAVEHGEFSSKVVVAVRTAHSFLERDVRHLTGWAVQKCSNNPTSQWLFDAA